MNAVYNSRTFFLATMRTLPCSMKYMQSAWSPYTHTHTVSQYDRLFVVYRAPAPDPGGLCTGSHLSI